jgi:ParB family chromosome partitioning protein
MKKGLGRGLSVLLNENIEVLSPSPSNVSSVQNIRLDKLCPGKYQPRKTFKSDEMDSLIQSVREKGIIQPLVIRKTNNDSYEIIAGERRFRASKVVGLNEVPVVIMECSNQDAFEIAIIENLQRDDLNPIEEAYSFKRLADEFGITSEEIGKRIGKSRSYVVNMLRLMNLPENVQELVRSSKLSAGHARALIGNSDAYKIAKEIIEKKLSVRDAERIIKSKKNNKKNSMNIDVSDVEEQVMVLKNRFDSLFSLDTDFKVKKSGATLQLKFTSFEEIDEFLEKLKPLES